jgi:hypothetical protein
MMQGTAVRLMLHHCLPRLTGGRASGVAYLQPFGPVPTDAAAQLVCQSRLMMALQHQCLEQGLSAELSQPSGAAEQSGE